MVSCKCVNSVDNVCYICSEVTFSAKNRPMIPLVNTAYYHSFRGKIKTRPGHLIFAAKHAQ